MEEFFVNKRVTVYFLNNYKQLSLGTTWALLFNDLDNFLNAFLKFWVVCQIFFNFFVRM